MGDVLDRAQSAEELFNGIALANVQRDFNKPSLPACDACGADIHPDRQALGGVTKCVECQTDAEKKAKQYAR